MAEVWGFHLKPQLNQAQTVLLFIKHKEFKSNFEYGTVILYIHTAVQLYVQSMTTNKGSGNKTLAKLKTPFSFFYRHCRFPTNCCGQIYSKADRLADPGNTGEICGERSVYLWAEKLHTLWGKINFLCVFMYQNCALLKRLLFFRFHKRPRERKTNTYSIHVCTFVADICVYLILPGCIRVWLLRKLCKESAHKTCHRG